MFFVSVCFVLAVSLTAAAQEKLPLITVSGEAEIRVVPDEVFYDLSMQTFHKDLKTAKAQTDERLKRIAELTQRYGVAAKDTQTDYISVEPRYRGNNEARQLIGYLVRKDLVFTLRDVSKAETMLAEILEIGVTRINDIDFRTSEMRKHRDEARAQAIRAAREKAVALTAEIGQNIGKAYSIEEAVPSGGSSLPANYSSNAIGLSSEDGESTSGTLAIGQIKVSARVVVRFELK